MGVICYLLDENIDRAVRVQLLRLEPEMDVLAVGDPGAPPLSATDPDILLWIEEAGRVLVTGNRRTMPGHVRNHLQAGHHIPGIFVATARLSLGEVIEELHLIWGASEAEEYQDLMLYLPLST